MNDPFPNEVEERRVIRLLADAADDVTPLSVGEVDELLRSAIGGATGGRPRLVRRRPVARRLQQLLAAGAAAAVVASGSLALTASQPQGAATDSGSTDARLASFPEGSALRLLLSIHSNGGRS
jgi:hypothetical protein